MDLYKRFNTDGEIDYHKVILFIILLSGILLRVYQYTYNRPFWLDEAMLSLNIVNRSWKELWSALDFNQVAPIGFLLIEKLMTKIFGINEYSLRLFPLMSGLVAIFMFYKLLAYITQNKNIIIIASLFFCLSFPLIYYSSEVKQYSSDVTILLLLYLMTFYIESTNQMTIKNIFYFSIIGALAVLFSFSSVFVLSSIGVCVLSRHILVFNYRKIISYLIIIFIWLLTFVLYYYYNLNKAFANNYLFQYWSDYFIKTSFISFDLVRRYFGGLIYFAHIYKFNYDFIKILCLFFFFIGCFIAYYKNKFNYIILLFPIGFTLAASALGKYPFSSRLVLFLSPIVIIFVAEGIEYCKNRFDYKSNLIKIVLLCFILSFPLYNAIALIINPVNKQDINKLLTYVNQNKKLGDKLFISYQSNFAYYFYRNNYSFPTADIIIGKSSYLNTNEVNNDLQNITQNKRIWIVFSHIANGFNRLADDELLLPYLDKKCISKEAYKIDEMAVYLYDFGG